MYRNRSLTTQGAWIEIAASDRPTEKGTCRSPRREHGLNTLPLTSSDIFFTNTTHGAGATVGEINEHKEKANIRE